MRYLCACALAALLLANPAFAEESTAEGRHFRVTAHFEGSGAARRALGDVEAVWPQAAEFFGLDGRNAPDQSLEVHLYRDMRSYAEAERKITGGQFARTGAFTAYSTRAAYVAVQPGCGTRELREFGLPVLTRIQLAHEACHVVSFAATRNFRSHPSWYGEGIATWTSVNAIVSDADGPGPAGDPYTARMMAQLQRLLESDRLPSVRNILRGAVGNLGFYERYAVWWSFFRLLMEGPDRRAFLAIAEEVNRDRCGPDVREFLTRRLDTDLGGLDRLDAEYRASVERFRPAWNEHRRSLEWSRGGWLQRAFASSEAIAWRPGGSGEAPYAFEGDVTLLAGRRASVRLLFARTDLGHLALEFAPDDAVRLLHHVYRTRRSEVLAEKRTALCRSGPRLRFRLLVSRGGIECRLRGVKLFRVSTEDVPLEGRWGLGADPGGGARWKFLRHPGPPLPRSRPDRNLPKSVPGLTTRLAKAADLDSARRIVRALSAAGESGWRALDTLIGRYERSRPEVARAAALGLIDGEEPRRAAIASARLERVSDPGVRGALLRLLVDAYPERAEAIHAALLDRRVPDRPMIFSTALEHGLPELQIRACLAHAPIASQAFAALRERGVRVPAEDLAVVARMEAPRGFSIRYAQGVQERLRRGWDWELLSAIARLVTHEDYRIRSGAHALLLTVSGKDMIADVDVWRSWIEARRGRYEIPDELSAGRVAGAVVRGAHYLRNRILHQGYCEYIDDHGPSRRAETRAGATGLAVLALRAAGVRPDDEAIRRALDGALLERNLHGQLVVGREVAHHNYAASILTMALASIDREKYRYKIQTLANRIAAGQTASGQWSYNTGGEYGKSSAAAGTQRSFIGDDSNTQYALLGLRAARKAGAEVDPSVWRRSLTGFLEGQDPWGGWGYSQYPWSGRERSMTPAAISSIAICLEGLYGQDAARRIAELGALKRGLVREGQLLIGWGYRGCDHYTFYGVERACVLTGTRRFNNYDWYRVGAKDLLSRQLEDGSWNGCSGGNRAAGFAYGPDIDTAYALLFLKRATTAVAGVRATGVVQCPKGPNRIRGRWPPRWPHLPEEEDEPKKKPTPPAPKRAGAALPPDTSRTQDP